MRHALALFMMVVVIVPVVDAESLYERSLRSNRPASSISDLRARREGDLLMVLVRETHRIELDEEFDRKRASSLDMKLEKFDIKPDVFNTLLPSLKGSTTESFSGDAEYEKRGRFEARITVTIIDVLPNGNLVIAGKRRISTDGETKTIRIAGIVRPLDVTSSNTVLSEKVGNAHISFSGSGPIDRATRVSPLDPLFFLIRGILPF